MSTFKDRQRNLFDHLKNAEEQASFPKTNKATVQEDYSTIDRRTYKRLKHEMKPFRGKESIYKREHANIRECLRAKTIPGFIQNPQNWVYYSLSDVTPDQMSDSTNTATALAFIRELEEKVATKTHMDQDSDEAIFKKPTYNFSLSHKKSSDSQKPVFKCGKVIMPEYVVGVTKKSDKKDGIIKRPSKDNKLITESKIVLKLDHLFEDD